MTNPTPSPVEHAALLGTEHGTQAGETWVRTMSDPAVPLDWPQPPRMDSTVALRVFAVRCGALTTQEFIAGRYCDEVRVIRTIRSEYETAFRVAVESTIRQACEEVTK